MTRTLWRYFYRWRFRLFQRHRYNRLVLERLAGRPLLVLPGVFNPVLFRSGEFFAQTLGATALPAGAAILDMGTGSGACAICAAGRAGRVVAVDVNPAAVRCSRINAILNQVDGQIDVRQGDLFTPVAGERFDVVLFNPPYFRGAWRDDLDRAWRSPDVVERFAAGLPAHLRPAGFALVVLSTDGDTPAFLAAFRGAGLRVEVHAQRDRRSEVLTVYRLTPETDGGVAC